MKEHYSIDWLTDKFEKGDSLKFLYFWGHTKKRNQEVGNFCFSQWYECSFKVNGLIYKTTEHWMMAQKALLFDNKDIFEKIVKCNKPAEAKELGRQVIGFDENIWCDKRFDIVRLGNIHKFNQNRKLGEYLLKTGNRILVEASPVDTIWGIGLTKDSNEIDNIYSWRGLNLLGFALMEARDFLRDFGFFTDIKEDLVAPWLKFPDADNNDVFWKMGKGEQFIIEFLKTYNTMSDKEKTIYKLTNPESYSWRGFYDE